MGQIVLGVAGGVIGSFFGMPQLGYLVGSAIGGVAFGPDGPKSVGPRLTDLKVQESSYGTRVPFAYGRVRLAGNLMWATDFRETKHTDNSGGKGGDGATATTFTYDCSFAVMICEGVIGGVRRIWADKTLIYDVSDGATAEQLEKNLQLAASIRVYTGDTTQDRDPTIVANEGLPFTPAYRGTAYIVFEAMQLANYGNRIPNLEFEIIKSISSTALQDPTILLNSNVQEGWIGLGAFGQTMLGRSFADNKRKRVWAGATTQVSTVNYLAYADMNARTTASLQISITPLFPGATYNVVYVPDVDSLILVPRNNGFGTQTLFEISPDTGNIKSQVTWNGTECPFMIFWDEYSKQVFGLTGASGGTSFALLRVAGIIIKGRDLLADFGATATGVFGQFGWRNNLGGIDNISLAVDGYATGLPGLEVVSGITSDPDWLYLQYNTGKLTQVDPLANFKQFVPVAGGFIGPVF